MPNFPTDYSRDGTEAHELLDYCLQGYTRSSVDGWALMGSLDYGLSEVALSERLDAVQVCLDYVYGILDAHPDAVLYNEAQYVFSGPCAPGEAGGTTDIAIHVPSTDTVYIVDYKHGAGVVVEPEWNEQLEMYAAAWCQTNGHGPANVVITIVQPRIWHARGPVREWPITSLELSLYDAGLCYAIAECESPVAPLVPGEKQCQFCPARPVCPAIEAKAIAATGAMVATFRAPPTLPDAKTLDVIRISEILQNKDFIVSWFNSVAEYAKTCEITGIDIPGFKVVEAEARRQWHGEPADVANKLVEYTGLPLDEVFPRKLAGVTEMEKAVVKAYRAVSDTKESARQGKEAMAWLTTKQSSGNATLVPDADPRPPLNRAARDFANVKVIDG